MGDLVDELEIDLLSAYDTNSCCQPRPSWGLTLDSDEFHFKLDTYI